MKITQIVCVLVLGISAIARTASAQTPVVVIGDDFVLQGTTTSTILGGSFSVTNGAVTCSGSFNPYDRSPTITMQTTCSDGKVGNVISTRDPTYRAGSGTVAFSDGSRAFFYFGAGAVLQAAQALARLQGVQPTYTAPPPIQNQSGLSAPHSVPMVKVGGTYAVPVVINDAMRLNFTVDTGAADVSIPADVVSTLIRTGTISKSDILGEQTYVVADGRKMKAMGFRIRSLRVGDVTIENVNASEGSPRGLLLLGQTFLERFPSWSIDNLHHALILQ